MIEKINLSTLELTSNYVLVKCDPDYGFKEVTTDTGVVKLYTSYLPQDDSKNYGISGTILKTPEKLNFYGELRTTDKGREMSVLDFNAMMRNSMPHDCDLDVVPGDNVLFNYGNQIDAIDTGRVLDVEGQGHCMLISYDTLFAKKKGEDLIPLNGWIFVIREQKPAEWKTPSGLWVVEKVDQYGSMFATVIIADKPVRAYMDKYSDGRDQLNPGDKIVIQKGWGYRIAYDMVAGDLKDLEVIRYKNVLGVLI